MAYLASGDVTVFPSTVRGNTQRSARLISEENLVNIVNKLVDKDAFVISQDAGLEYLEFIVNGYYFKVNYSKLIQLFPSSNDIYASIITGVNADNYTVLIGQDGQSSYEGVSFSSSEPAGELQSGQIRYNLKILTKLGGNWTIPKESLIKLKGFRIQDINVDGGEI